MKRFLSLLAVALSACSTIPPAHVALHGLSAKRTVQFMLQNPTLINGVPAEPEEWPASVYARMQGAACSATLIGERVLLIASHCVNNGEQLEFAAHANNYKAVCTQHPAYQNGSGNITADWALCLVSRPVTGVQFEVLGIKQKLAIGEQVTLSGYGCIQPGGGGGNDGIFRIGRATIDGLGTDKDYDVVTKGGAALCFGDSGGAAYLVDSDKRVIFGVNSRGDINTMSYLPAISSETFVTWALSWAKRNNNVRVCGLHSDALYCRNGSTLPTPTVDPSFEVISKSATVKGAVNPAYLDRKKEITTGVQSTLDKY